jgi:hypothetical protein
MALIIKKKTKAKRISKKDNSGGMQITLSDEELDSLMETWSALTAIMQAGKADYYKKHPGEFIHLLSALGFVEKGLGNLINNISLRSIAN